MNRCVINLDNLAQTQKLAGALAALVQPSSVILLKGDLGSGKTTFAQYFIKALCPEQSNITSPTFNLVHTYKTVRFDIWHFDFYRLKHIEEMYELGIEDALKYGVSLIEWPEIIENFLNVNNKITVHFQSFYDNNKRIVEITANGIFLI